MFIHRLGTRDDLPELRRLMERAIRAFLGTRLDAERVEASFEIMGIDTTLVDDGTYFVVECEGRIAGCGGWSRRATMFGGITARDAMRVCWIRSGNRRGCGRCIRIRSSRVVA